METLGTPFYGIKTAPDTIIYALKALAEGLGIQATARVFDVDADTGQDWLSQVAEHMEAISRYLIHELNLSQMHAVSFLCYHWQRLTRSNAMIS